MSEHSAPLSPEPPKESPHESSAPSFLSPLQPDTLSHNASHVSLIPADDAEIPQSEAPDSNNDNNDENHPNKSKRRRRILMPFEGIIKDARRRIPHLLSDYYLALHPKVLFACIFMFFTSIAPALSFGIMLNTQTEGQLGVTEVLFSTAIAGMFYSLFAGNGVIIVGVTGPVALMCTAVFSLSKITGVPFLPWLSFISLLSSLEIMLLSVLNVTVLVKYCTRFTLETFGVLIAIIYIVTAFKDLYASYDNEPIATAFLTTIFAFGTGIFANMMHRCRNWHILPGFVKRNLADCAVPLSVGVFTALMYIPVFHQVNVPYLPVPETFRPTPDRSWWIYGEYGNMPVWAFFAAIIPASILTALFFFDHNVSSMLSQQPEFNLKKKPSYHWDFFIVGVGMLISSMLALPPTNGLIPQAPLHVRALATIVHEKDPETGRVVERYTHVREQRISNFLHAMLIGILSIFGQVVLRVVPVSTMIGLFLFMGVSSFDGNQFFDRVKLLVVCTPEKRQLFHRHLPLTKYVHPVKQFTFTGMQILCAAIIFAVTETPAGIIFPLLILLLIPVRFFVMRLLFTKADLYYLDNARSDIEPLLPISTEEEDKESQISKGKKFTSDGSGLSEVRLDVHPREHGESKKAHTKHQSDEDIETVHLPAVGLRSPPGSDNEEEEDEIPSLSTFSASAMLPHAVHEAGLSPQTRLRRQQKELEDESFSQIMRDEE